MKKILLTVVVSTLFTVLCGCGMASDPADTESTLYIRENGSIDSLTVEVFPEDQYSAEELEKTVKEMADVYNNDHGSGAVKAGECRVEDGMAYVYLSYRSAEDYAAFNRAEFFYGKVSDALSKGYAKKSILKNTFGSNTVSGDAIADMGNYHMVVFNEPVQVRTYESILYISANVEPVDDRTVRMSSEAIGNAILILK